MNNRETPTLFSFQLTLKKWLDKCTDVFSWAPLYLIKRWMLHKTYFQLAMPAIGLVQWIRAPRVSPPFYLLFFLFSLATIQGAIIWDWSTIYRCAQVFLMIGFAHFVIDSWQGEHFLRFLKTSWALSVLYFFVEYASREKGLLKEFLPGLTMHRYEGIIGESNYTALFFVGIGTLSFIKYRRLFYFLFIFLIPFTGSRMGTALGLIPLLLFIPFNRQNKFVHFICRVLIILTLLTPFAYLLAENYLNLEQKIFLAKITSGRFPIAMDYFMMFKENIWGVGFYNGPELFKNFANTGSQLVREGYYSLPVHHFHQHNIVVQILSEMGWWGYLTFFAFVWKFNEFTLKIHPKWSFGFILIMVAMNTLNGFSEFIFYFYMGMAVREHHLILAAGEN